MKVTTENASLFSKSLASLNNLEKFNANVYWINSVEFQNLFIAGLHSMPKLTDLTLLFVLEEQLYPLFTEFLAESRISFLTLDNLDITNQLANGIKRMRFLTDFHVGRADCSITLLIPMPYSSVNKSLKNLTFWGLSFSDSEFVENGRIDLSEVDSFRITGIAGYASSGEVDLIPYLIQSLIGSAHLREFCCCVREETHFALVVEVIRTCPLLKIISVHNQTFKVVGLNLTADQIRLLEEPWFDSLRDSFYDAIDKSSVEKLQMTIRMVKKERLLRFLENSKTIGTVSIHTETMAELFDLSDLFRSVNLNSQSQFKTLSILLRILFSPPKSEIVRVYRHRSFVKVKFISTSESDENLPIYFGKILNSIIKSWESGCDIIDRVVLDELSDQDCKFLIQSCRSTFSFVKFEYKEGEYCCSR
ncbi:hypothetical protein HK098_005750 [Nowakowskiella sp. JEL0407]|nr:hypothetical protein HK098_005750 [Nowakowskiella sp. JEL0407]